MKNYRDRFLVVVCLAILYPATTATFAQDTYEWRGDKWVASARPSKGTAVGELAMVRELFESGKNKKCVKAAKKFLRRYPDSEYCEEVCLFAGQAEMKRKRYYQAYEWFEKLLDLFPSGCYFERALQKEFELAEAFLGGAERIALGFMRLPAKDEALEILTRIAEHAPGTQIAEESMLRIADYYNADAQWVEAADAYDAFVTLFSKSSKAPYAMIQAARATYSSYRGFQFDETPLLDAQQRFRNFAESFPTAAKKVNVGSILKQIVGARAERLYLTGQFYERTKRPRGAVFYYKQLLDQYPQTSWAANARSALQPLGEIQPQEPEVPSALIPVAPSRTGSFEGHRPKTQKDDTEK